MGRWLDPRNWRDYADLGWLADQVEALPDCQSGVDTKELPPDCSERAATPDVLLEKLRQWDLGELVIPHGTTWGSYTPLASTLDKQLSRTYYDRERQPVVELMSGHGNSEEYRAWRSLERDEGGQPVCPEPTPDYLPCCWRAGEIMRERCGDLPQEECEARVEEARRLVLEANISPELVFPDAPPEDWLDCGQCRDCFKPSFGYRPGTSLQYGLALSNFEELDDQGRPLRFRYGFLASSDNHSARPGTGYKQVDRHGIDGHRGCGLAAGRRPRRGGSQRRGSTAAAAGSARTRRWARPGAHRELLVPGRPGRPSFGGPQAGRDLRRAPASRGVRHQRSAHPALVRSRQRPRRAAADGK